MQIIGNNKETSFSRAQKGKEVHFFPKLRIQDKKEKENKTSRERRIVIQKGNRQLAPTLIHQHTFTQSTETPDFSTASPNS